MTNDTIIEAQARKWSVTLSSGDVDKNTLLEFEQWRSTDPNHARAFLETDRIWRGIASLEHLRTYATPPKSKPIWWKKFLSCLLLKFQQRIDIFRQPQGAIAGIFVLIVITLSFFWITPKPQTMPPVMSTHYQTQHAEIQDVILPDSSIITLGPETSLDVTYHEHIREVSLTAGNALFSVSSNPKRPFIVFTGNNRIRVVGTIFSINYKPQGLHVAVKEGEVHVGHRNESNSVIKSQVLTTGQSVSTSFAGNISDINTINPNTIGSWKEGRLIYKNTTLKEIVADTNRYYNGIILLADNATSELHVSIAFSIDDIDQMINNLAETLALDVNRDLPNRVVLQIKQKHSL